MALLRHGCASKLPVASATDSRNHPLAGAAPLSNALPAGVLVHAFAVATRRILVLCSQRRSGFVSNSFVLENPRFPGIEIRGFIDRDRTRLATSDGLRSCDPGTRIPSINGLGAGRMVNRAMDGASSLSLLCAAARRSTGAVDPCAVLGVGNGGVALGTFPKRHGRARRSHDLTLLRV